MAPEKAKELAMMLSHSRWPNTPLAMIRQNTGACESECGFLLPDSRPHVYLMDVWALAQAQRRNTVVDIERKVYGSFGAIYDDGWRVN